jgi:hypothetical protein
MYSNIYFNSLVYEPLDAGNILQYDLYMSYVKIEGSYVLSIHIFE